MPCELAYCEIYNPLAHGHLSSADREYIYGSFLLHISIPAEEFFNSEFLQYKDTIKNIYDSKFSNLRHPFVRNIEQTIRPYSLQIVKRIEYNQYTFCVVKTMWLRMLQRTWKRYYHSVLTKRRNPKNLIKRSIYGRWVY
mgnify:CR=1 FL=1